MQSNEQLVKDAKEYLRKSFDALFSTQIVESGLLLHDAMMISDKVEDEELKISCLNVLGRLYAISGHEQKAIDYFLSAISYALSHHRYESLPQFYNAVGTQYHISGNDAQAVKYFLEAEGALNYEDCKNHSQYYIWTALTYMNLSLVYSMLKDCERAGYYLEKVKPFFEFKEVNAFRFEYLVTEALYCWRAGRVDQVCENVDKLIEELDEVTNPDLDYIQGIYEICVLLLDMKEYDRIRPVVGFLADHVNLLDSMYYQIKLSEIWVECCRAAGLLTDAKLIAKEYDAFNKRHFYHGNETGSSYIDKKTPLYKTFAKTMSTVEELNINMGIGYISIDDLDICIDELGKEKGEEKKEEVLEKTERLINSVVGNRGRVFRNKDNEFIAIFLSVEKNVLEGMAAKISSRIKTDDFKYPKIDQGYVLLKEVSEMHMDDVVILAQKANKKAKEAEGRYFVSVL